MAMGPLFWTPTIEGLFNYEYIRDNPEHLDDPAWHEGLPPNIVDDIKKSLAHPERLDYFRATPSRRPTLARKFNQLREAGVTLLIGTDSGIPMKFHSGSTWRELDAWVNLLGVDAMTTIRAATYWPAVAMRKEREVGTVSPGKYADIIAVRGDVLRYINLLQRVDIVVKRGTRLKSGVRLAALRGLHDRIEELRERGGNPLGAPLIWMDLVDEVALLVRLVHGRPIEEWGGQFRGRALRFEVQTALQVELQLGDEKTAIFDEPRRHRVDRRLIHRALLVQPGLEEDFRLRRKDHRDTPLATDGRDLSEPLSVRDTSQSTSLAWTLTRWWYSP